MQRQLFCTRSQKQSASPTACWLAYQLGKWHPPSLTFHGQQLLLFVVEGKGQWGREQRGRGVLSLAAWCQLIWPIRLSTRRLWGLLTIPVGKKMHIKHSCIYQLSTNTTKLNKTIKKEKKLNIIGSGRFQGGSIQWDFLQPQRQAIYRRRLVSREGVYSRTC